MQPQNDPRWLDALADAAAIAEEAVGNGDRSDWHYCDSDDAADDSWDAADWDDEDWDE